MQKVARDKRGVDLLVVRSVLLFPKDEERVTIVPIKAIDAPLRILPYLSQLLLLTGLDRIELSVVFICALMKR